MYFLMYPLIESYQRVEVVRTFYGERKLYMGYCIVKIKALRDLSEAKV